MLRRGPSHLHLLLASLAALLAVTLIAPEASAARGAAQAATAASLVKSASVVGPLGISPFFALAGFGLASSLGIWTLPAGLEAFGHPAVWVGLILFGGLLQFGRSTKVTKPIAEALGTGESLFGVVAAIMVMVPHLSRTATPIAQAGVALGAVLIVTATTAVLALVVVRTALDVVIWLSPFPLVDAVFQFVKLAVTVGLVMLAVLFPPAAIVVNVLVLIGALLLARWAVRNARFGAAVAYDLTLGRFGQPLEMPRDPAVETDLGPFDAFVVDVQGYPKRLAVKVEMDAGRWFVKVPRLGKEAKTALGDDPQIELTPGFLGLELSSSAGRVLLPPRYKHLADRIVTETRVRRGERPALLARQSARRAPAQASAI